MKLTPAMKIILAVAAICIAITLITTNNIATVMVLFGLNSTPVASTGTQSQAVVQQQGTVNQGGTVSGDSGNAGTVTPTPDATQPSGGDNTTPTQPSGNAGSTGTTDDKKPADKNDGSTTAKSEKAEIVEYFNKSVNSVKTSAKEVKQSNVTNYLGGTPTIPSALNGIYKMLGGDSWLDGMLQDNSQGEATYTGADIKAKFPVEGEDYASKLTEADVAKATRTEANGVYTITIETVPDAKSDSVKHGDGHAPKAFNVILPGIVNDNIPSVATSLVGTATMEYPASTIVLKVDKATGNVISADYDLKWTINFDKLGAIIPLATKASYTVTY